MVWIACEDKLIYALPVIINLESMRSTAARPQGSRLAAPFGCTSFAFQPLAGIGHRFHQHLSCAPAVTTLVCLLYMHISEGVYTGTLQGLFVRSGTSDTLSQVIKLVPTASDATMAVSALLVHHST